MVVFPIKSSKLPFDITGFYTAYEFFWDENYYYAGEQHDFWEIVYVISGEIEVAEDERVYRLQRHNLIFHAPMEFHRIRSVGSPRCHILILTFKTEGEVPTSLSDGVFTITPDEQSKLFMIVNDVKKFIYENEYPMVLSQLSALSLTSFILQLTVSQQAKEKFSLSRSAVEYHNIVVTMSKGLYANLTLSDIAESCHISVSYIKTLFARYSGISPKTYYANMRFNEAVRLLSEGYSVGEISEMMNFSSPNYFSVFFKKQCGMPPAKYMQQKNSRQFYSPLKLPEGQ